MKLLVEFYNEENSKIEWCTFPDVSHPFCDSQILNLKYNGLIVRSQTQIKL